MKTTKTALVKMRVPIVPLFWKFDIHIFPTTVRQLQNSFDRN